MEVRDAVQPLLCRATDLLPFPAFYRVDPSTAVKCPVPAKCIEMYVRDRVSTLARQSGNGSGKSGVKHKRKGELRKHPYLQRF